MCNCNPADILSLILALPLVSAALMWLGPIGREDQAAINLRVKIQKYTQSVLLLLTLYCLSSYLGTPSPLLSDSTLTLSLIPELGISFALYLSPWNIWFLLLSSIVFCFVAFLTPFFGIYKRSYFSAINVLQLAVIGTLVANDLMLFYVCWELMLIPILVLMGFWGGAGRRQAAMKFVLFTIAGSLFMFAAIAYLGYKNFQLNGGTLSFSWEVLRSITSELSLTEQTLLFFGFMLGLLVKVPAFPLHGWLADSYEQSPYSLNLILAGLVGKLGVYGIMKLVMPLFPAIFLHYAPLLALLATVGIIYGAMLAFAETDLKRFIAYSSFSHVSYCLLALAASGTFKLGNDVSAVTSSWGLASFQIFSHGLIVCGLFVLVAILERQSQHRSINNFGGLASKGPALAVFFMLFMLASIGLPLTSGFVAEFLILLKTAEVFLLLALVAVLAVVFSAAYMLTVYMKIFYGQATSAASVATVSLRSELGIVLVFALALIFLLGIYPQVFLDSFARYVG
jgi:NADH-quinone oxidoreductase subunit M